MNSFMNTLICVVICFIAGLILYRSIRIYIDMKKIYTDFEEKVEKVENRRIEGVSDGALNISNVKEVVYDEVVLEENRSKYSMRYAEYVVCSQMIALLPLLGILGTVLGLIPTLKLDEISDLGKSGLSTALWTTVFGLVGSIALKWLDASFAGRMVNLIDAKFSMIDAALERQMFKEEIRRAITDNMKG